MAPLDPPPPANAPSAVPLIPKEVPPPIGFPPVRPLNLCISPLLVCLAQRSTTMTRCRMSSKDPFPPHMHSLSQTAMRSQQSTVLTLMHFWLPPLVPLFVGLLSSWCWCSCKGVNSSSIKLSPDSRLGLVFLQSGGVPQLLLPDCSLIVTWSSPRDQSLPCHLQQSFCPTVLRLSKSRGAAIMFPLRCITGVCPLALIWLASTLLCLLARCYVMGGMALSPTIQSHCMSILPWHRVLTMIMGGSSVQLPLPTKISTNAIPTMAILCIMGGTRPLKHLPQCIGGILLLLGMFLHLCAEVGQPFPRVMGGIPVRLHWLP
jgi:hypothetical protein